MTFTSVRFNIKTSPIIVCLFSFLCHGNIWPVSRDTASHYKTYFVFREYRVQPKKNKFSKLLRGKKEKIFETTHFKWPVVVRKELSVQLKCFILTLYLCSSFVFRNKSLPVSILLSNVHRGSPWKWQLKTKLNSFSAPVKQHIEEICISSSRLSHRVLLCCICVV